MQSPTSPWPRRTASAVAILTMPLIFLGGMVTTLRVGMAVPDWPTTFGHNMLTYPLTEMLKDMGVSWEHTHRLWGTLVGCVAIAMVLAAWIFEPRRNVRWWATFGLVAICAQGVLGGFRVLENSPKLAFLHGSLAQLVFVLLCSVALLHTRAWLAARTEPCKRAGGLRRAALFASGLVFVQIVLGAWLRHSGDMVALGLHVALAALVVGSVLALGAQLRLAAADGEAGGHDRSPLLSVRRDLIALIWVQLVLGVLTVVWVYVVTGPHNPVSVGEAIFATLHVVVGALLLVRCVHAAQWAHKLIVPARRESCAVHGLESV